MTIKFTIEGNGVDDGNAVPKLKMTGRQSWTPKAQRYATYKKWVQWALIDQCPERLAFQFKRQIMRGNKPITGCPDAMMTLMIQWANEKHGDAESIYGAIADALFENDKHLSCGGIQFLHDPGKKGKVEIAIKM